MLPLVGEGQAGPTPSPGQQSESLKASEYPVSDAKTSDPERVSAAILEPESSA